MKIIKVSILSAINTLFRLISSFVSVKIIALLIGPSGLAFVGQLQSAMSMCQAVSAGALRNGVIRYSAENKDNPIKISDIFSTTIILAALSSLLVSIFIAIFSEPISEVIFKDINYTWVVFLFAIAFPLFSVNQVMLAFLNGLGAIYRYVLCGVFNSLVAIVYLCVSVYYYKLDGALLYYTTWQSIVVFYTFYFIKKTFSENDVVFNLTFDKSISKNIMKYGAVAVLMAITVPGTTMLIRSIFLHEYGAVLTGYLQAIWRLSDLLLLFVTTTLSIYFLPKFSSIKSNKLLKNEVNKGLAFTFVISFCVLSLFYTLRTWLIPIIFSSEFEPISDLIFIQFVGAFIKSICWVFGTLLLAKGAFRVSILTECVFSISYLLFSYLLIDKGISGITYAYVIAYIINLSVLIFWYKGFSKNA